MPGTCPRPITVGVLMSYSNIAIVSPDRAALSEGAGAASAGVAAVQASKVARTKRRIGETPGWTRRTLGQEPRQSITPAVGDPLILSAN